VHVQEEYDRPREIGVLHVTTEGTARHCKALQGTAGVQALDSRGRGGR
jgi:hypothetical protein